MRTIGTYATRDPIGLRNGLAIYAYPLQPLEWCDPFGLAFFRGSRPGEPVSFATKPGEVKIDKPTGMVKPQPRGGRGVSLFDSAEETSKKGLTPNEMDMTTVPDTLEIHQQGKNPSHHEITPKEPMSEAAFNEELGKIKIKGGCGA